MEERVKADFFNYQQPVKKCMFTSRWDQESIVDDVDRYLDSYFMWSDGNLYCLQEVPVALCMYQGRIFFPEKLYLCRKV